MGKDYNSFLIKNCFPNFIKVMYSKQVYNSPEIRPNVHFIDRYLRPGLYQMILHVFIRIFDQFEVVKIVEKDFDCWVKSHFQVSKQWQETYNTDGFLKVRPSQLLIFLSMLLCHFDLLEITDTKDHSLFALDCGFKVEKVIIFVLVMGWVWHWVMNNLIFNSFWYFVLWICELDLSSSLMMKMHDWKTKDGFVGFVIPFFILFNYFLQ